MEPFSFTGNNMIPYKVAAAAKAEFLASPASASTAVSTSVKPLLYCSHKCLRRRSNRHDYTSCNGFIYEDGSCKFGYMDPSWIYEQVASPGSDAVIYFDANVYP